MITQLNRTVVEFRVRKSASWRQGLVVGIPRKGWITVQQLVRGCNTPPRNVRVSMTRTRRGKIKPTILMLMRRKHKDVDTKALQSTYMREWMSRKGPDKDALGRVLARAAELDFKDFVTQTNFEEVQKEQRVQRAMDKLEFHDPLRHPYTGQRLAN